MKKLLYSYLLIPLALAVATLNAQDQSRLNQAIATLEEYAAKFPQAVKKTINCARGIESCTQAEITQARIILGVISAALTVVTLGITAGVTAKAKGWWPFRSESSSEEPVSASRPRHQAPERPMPTQQAPPPPIPTYDPPQPPVSPMERIKKVLTTLQNALTNLNTDPNLVQEAVDALNRNIQFRTIQVNDLVPGSSYTIRQLLDQIKNFYENKGVRV